MKIAGVQSDENDKSHTPPEIIIPRKSGGFYFKQSTRWRSAGRRLLF